MIVQKGSTGRPNPPLWDAVAGLPNALRLDADADVTRRCTPHAWLLPKVAWFVCHGGIGTTQAALRALGVTSFCAGVGAARALDYAVVDMAFVTLMSYASNAAMLEREGVDASVAVAAIRHRLAAAPAALEAAAARMADRSDGAYESDPTATLATWRNFFDSRRPYLDAIGASRVLPDFCIDVLDRAGASGAHGGADVTRVQEVLRYNDG